MVGPPQLMPTVPLAALTAIDHGVPVVAPLLAPGEGAAADRAGLLGQERQREVEGETVALDHVVAGHAAPYRPCQRFFLK